MRIAITGSSGYVGSSLIRRLAHEVDVEAILAIDIRRPSASYPPNVTHVNHNVVEPLESLLSDFSPDAVVHLAFVLSPGRNKAAIRRVDLTGTANALIATALSGAKHFLYFSSTTIYGPHPDNPEWLTEESFPRPLAGFQYSVDKLDTERLIDEFATDHPEISVGVFRGCPVMGSNADNFISRAFAKRMLIGISGYDPPMQLMHEDDLVDLLLMTLKERVTGVYNIASKGFVRWSDMAKILDRTVIALPAAVLYSIAGVTWTLGLQSESPAAGLAFIQHRWTASTQKIKRELGIDFTYEASDAWAAYAESLRKAASKNRMPI